MSDFTKLTGKASWAKVFPDDRDMKGYEDAFVECNGAYTINLELDDISMEKLKESGSKLTGRKDGTYLFKRKHEVYNKKDGTLIAAFSGPPQVVDEDGENWPADKKIGNGSVVEVAITATPDKAKPSIVYTRLEGVKVLEWVEFGGDDADAQPELPF